MVGGHGSSAHLSSRLRPTRIDRFFDAANTVVLSLVLLAVAYPLYFMVIASFSNPDLVNSGAIWLLPRDMTLEGYRRLLGEDLIFVGYRNTILYASVGTMINLAITIPAAYALSRIDLPGVNAVMFLIVLTMFFQGGIIPRYLVVRQLGLIDTIWAMVLPNAVGTWNLIIARTFFRTTIPADLLDASRMDGCGNLRFFAVIVLPLSSAILAVMLLFYVVRHWNTFFDALMFLRRENRYPLQLILRELLIEVDFDPSMMDSGAELAEQMRMADLIRYGAVVVASAPVLALYPFVQRYFVKGVMIGAIKG